MSGFTNIQASSVNSSYVRNFIHDHAALNYFKLDEGRTTTAEHADAVSSLATLYTGVMEDGGLNADDRSRLAKMMTSTNDAALDAYYDHVYGAPNNTKFDPGYHEPSDLESTETAEKTTAEKTTAEKTTVDKTAVEKTTADKTTDAFKAYQTNGRYAAEPEKGDISEGMKGSRVAEYMQELEGAGYEGLRGKNDTDENAFWGPKMQAAHLDYIKGKETTETEETTDKTLPERHERDNLDIAHTATDADETIPASGRITMEGSELRATVGAGGEKNIIGADGRATKANVVGADLGGKVQAWAEGDVGTDQWGAGAGVGLSLEADASAMGAREIDKEKGTDMVHAKAGLYAGALKKAKGEVRTRWFDISGEAGAGVGVGAKVGGHAGFEEKGVYSLGMSAYGGAGGAGGGGLGLRIKTDVIKEDAKKAWNGVKSGFNSFTGWVGDKATAVGNSVSNAFNNGVAVGGD